MVQLEDPTPEELVKTAHAIIDHPSHSENEIHSSKLTPYLKSLADGYLAMCSRQTFFGKDDYFGLRDFYCLIKMLRSLCRHYQHYIKQTYHDACCEEKLWRNTSDVDCRVRYSVVSFTILDDN